MRFVLELVPLRREKYFKPPPQSKILLPFKAGVNPNWGEILVSLKRGWKGKRGLSNTTRQLPDRTMAPQVVGQLFGVYVPIFNFKL